MQLCAVEYYIPVGRRLIYSCGTASAMNDACSRIEFVFDSTNPVNLATYQ